MKQYKLPLIDGREISFSSINAEDADKFYQAIISQPDNPNIEEFIFNTITDGKYVEDLSSLDAGIILTVIYAALYYSKVLTDIKDFPEFIEHAREEINNNAYNLLYTTILKAMPSYKLKELKDNSLEELLELFALSENILEKPSIDLNKLRDILGIVKVKNKASGKYESRQGKGVALIKDDELKSLTKQLNFLEEGDFDETGKYIGEGSML